MFLVAVIVLGALAVPLSGGRLGALADLRLRRPWAIYAALGLAILGDTFAIPASWPLSNVFSAGDVLIGAGLVWGMHRVCGSRLVPRWTGKPAAPPPGPP